MNKKTKSLLLLCLPIVSLLFMGQLCGGGADGGIFMSFDKAENWEQKNLLGHSEGGFLSSSRAITNDGENIITIYVDPFDENTIYYGTVENGLYKTTDNGELWAKTGLTTGAILSISANPKNNNIIFAGQNSSVTRSEDAGETWETVHTDPQGQWLRAVVVDWYDPEIIYAASENGSIIKSKDNGESWNIVHQIDVPVKQLIMDSFDSRVLYAADKSGNIFKTIDAGKEWTQINDKDFYNNEEAWPVDSKGIFKLALDPSTRNRLYGSSYSSIVRSNDGGKTWTIVNTLIPYEDEKHKQVENLIVDPDNPKIIYFTIVNIIHKTNDLGKNWHTIENFPSARRISYLTADKHDDKIVIAGTREIEEQGGLIGN
ncbi:hypothetical protein KKC88_05225 [Patescibacteria group bacterium]|nr:hypothetical protein [Patescibacteria group bacterium]MBU1673610.1 hypothetical protein [Patescibacteria group bacterium]MBU1964028.1 hypothetical protein [Patescibacteria group bacterium]